jgi:hypothetical protein
MVASLSQMSKVSVRPGGVSAGGRLARWGRHRDLGIYGGCSALVIERAALIQSPCGSSGSHDCYANQPHRVNGVATFDADQNDGIADGSR